MSHEVQTMRKTVIQEIVTLLRAIDNCRADNNGEWLQRHNDQLTRIVRNALPSGSGFDNGTTLVRDEDSTYDKIVFKTAFHHMDKNGMYAGWTEHMVIVKPAFDGLDIRVTGRDRNEIKAYIAETFDSALTAPA